MGMGCSIWPEGATAGGHVDAGTPVLGVTRG